MKKKMSRAAQNAIEGFDRAAKDWGWTSDQGHGAALNESELAYKKAKQKLEKLVRKLEKLSKRESPIARAVKRCNH